MESEDHIKNMYGEICFESVHFPPLGTGWHYCDQTLLLLLHYYICGPNFIKLVSSLHLCPILLLQWTHQLPWRPAFTYHKPLHTFTVKAFSRKKLLVKQSLHVRVSNEKPINGDPWLIASWRGRKKVHRQLITDQLDCDASTSSWSYSTWKSLSSKQ